MNHKVFLSFCFLVFFSASCRQIITGDYELKTAKKICGYWKAEVTYHPGADAGRFYFWYTLNNELGDNIVTYTPGETAVQFMTYFITGSDHFIDTRWWIKDRRLYLGSTVDYLVVDIVQLKNDFCELRSGNYSVYLYRISDF